MYGGGERCIGSWWGNLGVKDHWGDPGVDGRIILSCILSKWDMGYGLNQAGSG